MFEIPTPPSEIALTKIVNARMKMINDALPNTAINLLTTCCPIKAAIVATAVKKRTIRNWETLEKVVFYDRH
nr:Os08g0389733 [Ipomoea batatas]GMC77883.1 Os08g0389733 [Ipomoea batatas]GME09563.1 Os08g0389733 [Ipomoea batatas]